MSKLDFYVVDEISKSENSSDIRLDTKDIKSIKKMSHRPYKPTGLALDFGDGKDKTKDRLIASNGLTLLEADEIYVQGNGYYVTNNFATETTSQEYILNKIDQLDIPYDGTTRMLESYFKTKNPEEVIDIFKLQIEPQFLRYKCILSGVEAVNQVLVRKANEELKNIDTQIQ